MEPQNKIGFGSAHNISPALASLEQVLKTQATNSEEECAAFRQQSALLKFLNKRVADDIAIRSWMRYYSFDKHCQDLHKDLNIDYTNDFKNLNFPDVDELTSSIDFDENNGEMFEEVRLKGNQEQTEDECMPVKKQTNNGVECTLYKTRNTMDKFLSGNVPIRKNEFNSARQILAKQMLQKNMYCEKGGNLERAIGNYPQKSDVGFNFSASKKSLGSLGRVVNSSRKTFVSPKHSQTLTNVNCDDQVDSELASILSHPALKNIDIKMVELINNEIVQEFKPVDWNEIAGLNYAKSIIKEAVVYPLLRPDIFTGLRRPPKGILLFGPPGTGKTLIGKCIASQSSSTFFTISSATLTSKWMGEGEKMVRALFAVAVARQPSVIFIDEIDALLSQRSENENEGTRRLKTEFLVRLDGTSTSDEDRILVVGATNRPQELDEAVRRRFVKRLYVPLPELDARSEIISNLLRTVENDLNVDQIEEISKLTEGYSCADMDSLCREASMEPLRSLSVETIITYRKENLRKINVKDFYIALKKIRPSVSQSSLSQLVEWNKIYGSSF